VRLKPYPRPADDARRCRRGPGSPDRLVQSCQRQAEPDPAEMAARYGADTSVLDWLSRRVLSGGANCRVLDDEAGQ
jgi:hypothetical protein